MFQSRKLIFEKDICVTRFSPMFHFYTPWKRQKTSFSNVSEGIEMEYWTKMG